MDFARQQRDPTKHMIGITFVVVLHAVLIYALLTGLGKTIVEVIKKPLSATIIDEIKAPPPPPPPPRKIVEVPKAQPQTYVPPPDIPMPTTQSEPVISVVTATPPPEPVVIAPPVVVAPPAPPPPAPKPAIRRGALLIRVAGEAPTFPREAARAGVGKGRVVVRLQIDEKGNVTDVQIVASEPSGVFDRAVRLVAQDWKYKADGDKYVGEVEVNFTLKD